MKKFGVIALCVILFCSDGAAVIAFVGQEITLPSIEVENGNEKI